MKRLPSLFIKSAPKSASDNPRHVSDLETDEFWSFVGAKKRRRR
jgi:hypothetical protein